MEIFKNTHIDFMGMRKFSYVLSLLVLIAGIVSLIVKGGPKLGIDFTGGTVLQLNFAKDISNEKIRQGLEKTGYKSFEIQRFVGSKVIALKLQESNQITSKKIEELKTSLGTKFVVDKIDVVGPAVGSWLIKRAIVAFLLAFIAIIIYVAFRFNAGIWGVASVLALFHDVLVAVGIFSILNKEITMTVVAALMTIVGYSINDTIVIYDRIRENLRSRYKEPLGVVINDSINQTLSRTTITTMCTMFTVISLFLFGGETLRDFSLCLIIGMTSGIYSTIYVASPIVYDFKMYHKNKLKHILK